MKEPWWSAKAAELQDAANKKDFKAFYQGLKEVYGPKESRSSPILASDGKTKCTNGVKFEFRTSGGLFNHQRFTKLSNLPKYGR